MIGRFLTSIGVLAVLAGPALAAEEAHEVGILQLVSLIRSTESISCAMACASSWRPVDSW